MPVAIVGAAYMYAGATAFAAATAWSVAAYAAAATFVGGVMTVVGATTGNEKLAKQGMVVGAIGSIATALVSPATAATEGAKKTGETGLTTRASPTTTAAGETNYSLAGGGTSPGQGMATPASSTPAATTNAGGAATNAATNAATKQDLATLFTKFDNAAAARDALSLKMQVIGMGAQAYSAHETAATNREISDRDFAQKQGLIDTANANANNLTGLTIPRVNLPRFGLIDSRGR